MKKLTALILCLALTLSCTAALAETAEKTNMGTVNLNGAFEARCVLPEGYTMETTEMDNGGLLSTILSKDPAKPILMLSIMFDEMYAEVKKLNDLDDEAIAYIESTFTDEYEVEISYQETIHGTKLMVVKEANNAFADVYTIYEGYEFEFVLFPSVEGGAESLTDDQIQMVIEFLGNLDFIPVEE